MATRRQKPPVQDPPVETDPTLDPQWDDGGDDPISLALAEIGEEEGGTVKVERVSQGRNLEYVDDFDVPTFTLRALREQFGGGEYRLTIKNGRGQYVLSRRVRVAAPRTPPAPAVVAPSALDQLADIMKKQTEQLAALLVALSARQAPPAVDPAASRRELLQDMVLMKSIMGGSELGPDKLVDVMKMGVDLAREAQGGDGDWSTVAMKALDRLADPLADIMRQQAAASGRPATAAQALPATAQPASPPSQKGNTMQQYVALLVTKAAAGADPGLYADVILDNVPGGVIRQLLTGDVVATLATLDPRVNQHAQWFRDLGAMLSEALADVPGSGSDAADKNGNPQGAA